MFLMNEIEATLTDFLFADKQHAHLQQECLDSYEQSFAQLLEQPIFATAQAQKQTLLLNTLTALHHYHLSASKAYANLFQHHELSALDNLSALPYLAVRLFKHLTLQSVPDNAVFKTLYSSGTTSQTPAKVILDRATSARQSKVLVKILQTVLGKKRLPMLIIDSASVLKAKNEYSARGAGIQGLAMFGRDHTYALDDNMQPNWQAINAFAQRHSGQPILIFGFTFMVWQYFVKALQQESEALVTTQLREHFAQATLLHSGGWKKLEAQKVSNTEFKASLLNVAGIERVYNFYGMAEQVGSIFLECEHGHLHAPVFADVIIRHPFTLQPVAKGQQGLVQVLSALPSSYPGQSILTEDTATFLGEDDCPCGRKGRYFLVNGRLPKTEIRGCSDTHQ